MEGNFNTMTIKNASLNQTITKVGNMKQKSHPWAQLPVLLLIVASAVVLLTVTALANSPSSVRSKAGVAVAQPVATVPTAAPPGSHIYISTSHSGHIDINPGDDDDDDVAAADHSDEVKFKSNDILSCTINPDFSCTWSVYLKGSDIGISGANLRDFEVLANGDVIFAIDRKKTLTVDGASTHVTARDVLRYDAIDGTLHSVLVGAAYGLTKSSEDIDSVAWTPDGHLVIGTRGTAKYSNGLEARDRDLVKIVGGVPVLYFVGDPELHKSSEDINAAWIANPSENLYLVTKGNFTVHNGSTELKGKKSDILGCAPLTHDPITSCFFFSFFKGKPQDLDKQIDGLSIDASEPVASSAVTAALQKFADNSAVDEADDAPFDAEGFNEAVSQNDPDISAEDFIDVRTQMYLPMVANH